MELKHRKILEKRITAKKFCAVSGSTGEGNMQNWESKEYKTEAEENHRFRGQNSLW